MPYLTVMFAYALVGLLTFIPLHVLHSEHVAYTALVVITSAGMTGATLAYAHKSGYLGDG